MKTTHAKFYKLLSQMPYETKETIVHQYSGQTSLSKLYKEDRQTYDKMLIGMQKTIDNYRELDQARKRVIASIAVYFMLRGDYQNLTYPERLLRVKATAERAAGGKYSFNEIPLKRLRQISYEFTRKQELYMGYRNLKALKDICPN